MSLAVRSNWIRVAALVLVACVSGYFCRRADLGLLPAPVFYVSLIVFAVSLWMLVPRALIAKVQGSATVGHTLIALVVLLPVADYIFVHTQSKVIESTTPVYSFRAAKGNPKAFSAWWAYYANEWKRPNGFKASTERPDPQGVLPFVMVPNSSGQFFQSVMRINNLGFRGRDIERVKGNRYRLFALGESATLGPTINRGDRPWPDMLQALIDSLLSCARPIEVINAGTEFYTLKDNLERLRRDIIPLKPDLVISYHGYNGLRSGFMEKTGAEERANKEPPPRKRPSALIEAARDKLYLWRKKKAWVATYSAEVALHSRYADLYRQLISLAHENHFQLVLANSSLAVNASSPQEVREFYGNVFQGIDTTVAQNAAHNRMVKTIADSAGVPFIDTTPNLDGVWDADVYLDLVHFTPKGNHRIAQSMFDGIAPILQNDASLKCIER
jgi:lysophospholipase L1-like esterase